MIKSDKFLSLSSRLPITDFSNLLYACSHLNLLDKNYEWPILLEAFSHKIQSHFDIRHAIKCMLSLALAKVGTREEFWQPLLNLIIIQLEKTNGNDLLNDLYIVTNLLYMLAAQEDMSTPD
jgi:hypothetical protein